jgi:hypothetical protein
MYLLSYPSYSRPVRFYLPTWVPRNKRFHQLAHGASRVTGYLTLLQGTRRARIGRTQPLQTDVDYLSMVIRVISSHFLQEGYTRNCCDLSSRYEGSVVGSGQGITVRASPNKMAHLSGLVAASRQFSCFKLVLDCPGASFQFVAFGHQVVHHLYLEKARKESSCGS